MEGWVKGSANRDIEGRFPHYPRFIQYLAKLLNTGVYILRSMNDALIVLGGALSDLRDVPKIKATVAGTAMALNLKLALD